MTIREKLENYKKQWKITDYGVHEFFMAIPGDLASFLDRTDAELEEMYARWNIEREET